MPRAGRANQLLVTPQFGALGLRGWLAWPALWTGLLPVAGCRSAAGQVRAVAGAVGAGLQAPGNFNLQPLPRAAGQLVQGGPYGWERHPHTPLWSRGLGHGLGCAHAACSGYSSVVRRIGGSTARQGRTGGTLHARTAPYLCSLCHTQAALLALTGLTRQQADRHCQPWQPSHFRHSGQGGDRHGGKHGSGHGGRHGSESGSYRLPKTARLAVPQS